MKSATPSSADERALLSREEQCVALWQAIKAIKIGNPTDDKLIVKELHAAGYCIARASLGAAQVPAVSRETVIEWLDWLGIEVTHRQLDGLFAAGAAKDTA